MGIFIFPSKQYKENYANLKRREFPNFQIQQTNKGCIQKLVFCKKIPGLFHTGSMNR